MKSYKMEVPFIAPNDKEALAIMEYVAKALQGSIGSPDRLIVMKADDDGANEIINPEFKETF